MDEFREIVKLAPVMLDKTGLSELERVLAQDLTPRPDSLRIRLADGARTIVAHSVDQLFQSRLPASNSRLSIDVTSWNQQGEIDAGVSLTLSHNYANYQLHALSETLYLGKKAQLDGFFRRHRPWYASINQLLPIVGPPLFFSALFAASLLTRQRAITAAVLSATLAAVSGVVFWLGFTERIFPYVRVRLTDRPTGRSGWEVTTLILEVGLLIATILSILIPFASTTPN